MANRLPLPSRAEYRVFVSYPKECQEKEFGYSRGKNVLGLTPKQATRLFYAEEWPNTFQPNNHMFDESCGTYGSWVSNPNYTPSRTKKYAKLVAARIDHFIATDGRE